MEKVNTLGKRIEKLKQKKLRLEHMQARILVKELKGLVGKHYSPELTLTIFKEIWQNASDQQKEVWHRQAEFFRSNHPTPSRSEIKRYPLPNTAAYAKENDSSE